MTGELENSTFKATLRKVRETYAIADALLESTTTLVWSVRNTPVERWQGFGASYAAAFVAWHDLSLSLSHGVRETVRSSLGPDARPVVIGRSRAKHSILEWAADELGTVIRNSLYFCRRTPFEPEWAEIYRRAPKPIWKRSPRLSDFLRHEQVRKAWIEKEIRAERRRIKQQLGIKTAVDALLIIANEWKSQSPEAARGAVEALRCGNVRFDEVTIQLDFESRVVARNLGSQKEMTTRRRRASQPNSGRRQPRSEAFPFTDDHLTVLTEVAGMPTIVKASELHGKSGMPEYDRIVQVLADMEKWKPPFVERPRGPRSGFRATEAGMDELRKRVLMPPST